MLWTSSPPPANFSDKPFQGRPSPLRPWCIFPLFQISPLFSKNYQSLCKIFKILSFPEKFLDFHPTKFLMTFFSHWPQISNSPPIFPVSVHFPLSRENYYFPYFEKFPLCFRKIHLLFTYFMCISFPPTLTMMLLCITQCTYWTPLNHSTETLFYLLYLNYLYGSM